VNWKTEIIMENQYEWTWNVDAIAKAFEINTGDIESYLSDGRRVSFIIERRIQKAHEGWTLAKSEGAGFDLSDPHDGKWEVRSITKQGVYFNPSNQVGSGRAFNEEGFLKKLGNLKGFILADIVEFPKVKVFVVPSKDIRNWYSAKLLGKNAKISRKVFLEQLWQKLD
jgi:hypothetical protein